VPLKSSQHQEILLIEDNTQCSNRRSELGVTEAVKEILVGIHHINSWEVLETIAQKSTKSANLIFALDLIDKCKLNLSTQAVIAANTKYGCNPKFIQSLQQRDLNFCVKVRPSTKLLFSDSRQVKYSDLIDGVENWEIIEVIEPTTGNHIKYSVCDLGIVVSPVKCRAFVAQRTGISGVNADTIIGLSSLFNADLAELVRIIGWTSWIRPILRNKERELQNSTGLKSNVCSYVGLNLRSNITTSRQEENDRSDKELKSPNFRGIIQSEYSQLNIAELFAGAGGMGLGFLMANNYKNLYRVIFSGEVHPIYAQTLRQNHEAISRIYHSKRAGFVPNEVEPVDLRNNLAYESIANCANKKGGVQIIIGGPPCQGFSSSNRNSGDESNPHNRLVDVFMDYVERIRPPVALMENVQGIVWAKNYDSTHESLLDYFTYRMKKAGYLVFKRLLDAAWYGVPQFRYRFFVVLIHQDLGYREEDFDPEWGAFPFPTHGGQGEKYVTVEQAISDLPPIGNGWNQNPMSYGKSEFVGVASRNENQANIHNNPFLQLMRQSAEPGIITDHITSRHADYVIERYREIPPGGNWQSIKDKMTNYANLDRTHSNIYRRLTWSDPSVTIGHYRKSMLVHPEQHRGLSFREAARLQSFPDWFLFAGTSDGKKGGLMHKQQQVANAVCPLLTKAIAEFILKL
jgi:DNA-cytosine methyltransferase